MALQQLAPQPTPTGLSNLGAILADIGDTNARNRRQDVLLDRARAQQLQDVQSSRDYEATREKRQADLQFEQEKRLATAQMDQGVKKEMISRGYLAYPDRDNEPAVATALARFTKDGWIEKYSESIARGDMKIADIGDTAKTDAALQTTADAKAKMIRSVETAKVKTMEGGQAEANRLLLSATNLQNTTDKLEADLQKPPPGEPPEALVVHHARELWLMNHPGEKVAPTDTSKMAAEMVQSIKELKTAAFEAWSMNKQQSVERLNLIRYQNTSLSQERGKVGERGFYPDATATPPPMPPALIAPDAGLRNAAPDATTNFVKKLAPPTTPNPTPPPALQNPLDRLQASALLQRPVVQQGRARLFAPETPQMYDSAAQVAQEELQRLQAMPPSRATVGRVAYLNEIIGQLAQKKKQLLGVPSVPAPATPPSPTTGAIFSDPIGASAPAFGPSSPGGFLPRTGNWYQTPPTPAPAQ